MLLLISIPAIMIIKKIATELDDLACPFVQIRCFSHLLSPGAITNILKCMAHTSIQAVELILKYDAGVRDEAYIQLVASNPLISDLILHTAPEARTLAVDYGCDAEAGQYIRKEIRLCIQELDSAKHCGLISLNHLSAPTVNNFYENKLFNGCLNRKIAVDVQGLIKNCPSMMQDYGNIKDIALSTIAHLPAFRQYGKISKDQITVCKDCEFRYACTDCRAFVEQPGDLYSKPLKCGYDPYSGDWQNWKELSVKEAAIIHYKF